MPQTQDPEQSDRHSISDPYLRASGLSFTFLIGQ